MNKLLVVFGLLASVTLAHAQSYWTDAGGAVHGGVVDMSLNASSQPVPDSSANPHPVTCISGCASPAVPTVAPTGASLAVTSSTGNVAFANSTSTYPVALLLNDGSTEIFVNLGNSSVTAATTNIPIPAGNSIQVGIGSATNVAGITATLTSTLRVIQLTGPTNWAGGGGGGSGSNASVSATGSGVPASATYSGMNVGGNLIGFVGKAASTAAAAADPSLVTNESPNSQLSTAIGTTADAAWSSGSGSAIAILKTVATNAGASVPTGSNVIGGVFGSPNVTPTDCSIALTLGGSAQNILATSSTRHGFTIANIDTSAGSGEPVWFSITTTAAASTTQSYPLAAPTATTFANLSSYTTPFGFGVNTAVSVIAATTGHKISCTQW